MADEIFMQRCFELALLGAGSVSPNPMVGAVIVHENRIIGEGWHRQYGQAHAEVNAVNSVAESDRHLLSSSTLYVSLEPCCIHRNTPPCTDLILRLGIPNVVVSCLDKTPDVNGKGISLLRQAGVSVTAGVLQEKGEWISRFRNTFATRRRPYVLLKYAQSKNGFMAQPGRQVWFSNNYSKRLVHKIRAEYDAILIGTNTALTDNPRLDNRLWFGKSPIRVVLDRQLRIPQTHHLYDGTVPAYIVTHPPMILNPPKALTNVHFVGMEFDQQLLPKLLSFLAEKNVSSLIVEGGAATLRHFLALNLWDEAMVFTSSRPWAAGIEAPRITGGIMEERRIGTDTLTTYINASEKGR